MVGLDGLAMMPSAGTRHDTEVIAARRRARVVAAVAGLSLAPYFWLASAVVGWPADDAPPLGAPPGAYLDFYLEGVSSIPIAGTVAIGSWAIWLVLVVAVVRAACRRLDLAAVVAVTLAGASTAVRVVAEGVLAWPAIGMTAAEILENVDGEVARAMVMSRDGLLAAASVALGISMVIVSWLLARSDLWGRWLLAAVGFLAAVSACASMVAGPDALGPGGVLVWGVLVGVVVVVDNRRGASGRGR
jgi:hypothetical protein